MSAIGVEEAAAVRAQFLNDFLRSNRPLGDGLLRDGVHHRLSLGVNNRLAVGPTFCTCMGSTSFTVSYGFRF